MAQTLNKSLDKVSEYLAPRKGLLPFIGILFVIANFVLQYLPIGWLADSNLFLHLGVIIAVFGLMLAWAL